MKKNSSAEDRLSEVVIIMLADLERKDKHKIGNTVLNGKCSKHVSEPEELLGMYQSQCHYQSPEVGINIARDLGNCGQG